MLVHILMLVFVQAGVAVGKPFYDTRDYGAMGRHFENFLQKHNKMYDETEKVQRFEYFLENVKKINELNALHKVTFDINHYTDWSENEQTSLFGLNTNIGENFNGDCKVLGDPTTHDAPPTFDWRDQGAVSPAKEQSHCGSCWAFCATALVESKLLMQNKKMILSEQQLVDCDQNSHGCEGGLPSYALTYLIKAGQMTEKDYPYKASDGTCKFDASKVVARVLNCTDYNLTDEEALKELLFKEGPLAISIAADISWTSYKGGIWDKCDNHELSHGVLLVAYGSENGEDFWTIKDSAGPKFGEQGFIRIKRGVNCCGIAGTGTNKPFAVSSASVV